MACFLVPTTEAVITTVTKKKIDKRGETKNPFIKRMNWLNNMLWGGSALLLLEHVWHGELAPWFPFLTKVSEIGVAGVLREMATSGVTMAALVTAVWAGMAAVANSIEKRPLAEQTAAKGGRKE